MLVQVNPGVPGITSGPAAATRRSVRAARPRPFKNVCFGNLVAALPIVSATMFEQELGQRRAPFQAAKPQEERPPRPSRSPRVTRGSIPSGACGHSPVRAK